MTRARLFPIVVALLCAACSSDTGTSPSSPPEYAPTTFTWSSNVVLRGATSFKFTTTRPGPATATIAALDGSLTLAFGVPPPSGAGCRLTHAIHAVAGDTLAVDVAQGDYCVQVSDEGSLVVPVDFVITLTYP